MIVGMRGVAVVVAAALGGAPVSAHAPPPSVQETPEFDGPDIVVIARKLRKVRISYDTRGRHVRRCAIERSSGDDRIDRIMCAILRACAASGQYEVEPARACMAARIDSLDAAGEAAMLHAAAPPVPVIPPTRQDMPRPDGPDIVVTGQDEPDIVVTGSNPTMRGGLWRFRRSGTIMFGGGIGRPVNFTQCLPPGAIEAMLRRAAGETSSLPGAGYCGNIRVAFADGRITGSRSCSGARDITRLALTGRYDARRLTLNYNVERDHNGPERGGGPGWNPQRQVGFRWQVTATREGDCPLRERRDQLNGNEIVSALFSERGPSDDDRNPFKDE